MPSFEDIIIGSVVSAIIIIMIIPLFGMISDYSSEHISEDSSWSTAQKDIDKNSQSVIELFFNNPVSILITVSIALSTLGISVFSILERK